MKKYLIFSVSLLSFLFLFAFAKASAGPIPNLPNFRNLHKPNSVQTKPTVTASGGNLTGALTAMTANTYTLLITNKDKTTVTETIGFDAKTKVSIPRLMVPRPHNLNKPNLTKPELLNPHTPPTPPQNITTTKTPAPTLQVGDNVRIKVKTNADGTFYALSVHLAPTRTKKNK